MGDRSTAVMFYNNGVLSSQDKTKPGYIQHAYQQFCSSMYMDPTWATAAYQAGNNVADMGFVNAAIACWRRALECELPDSVPLDSQEASRAKVFCNLGLRLEMIGRFDESLAFAEKATKTDPNLSSAWLNLSILQTRIGKLQEGVDSARKAFELLPQDSTTEMGLAFAMLFNRNLAEGFKHFEARYSYRLHNFEKYPTLKWLGEPDRTLFIVSDQGIGDTLSMARFLRAVCAKSRYVHAAVHPELLRLFQYSLMDVANLNVIPQPCSFPAHDAWTTFVSLPFALGLTDDQIRNAPQIKFDAPRTNAAQWKVPDRKLHVGIAWGGSALNEINIHRIIPLAQMLDLYRVPGIQLYSLQVDASKHDLNNFGAAALVRDLSGYISDITSTCSLLRDLDLVIGCESALGHICTLADAEFWCPYSFLGRDYRIGFDGSDQVWSKYRVFKQGPDLQWQPVFDKIVEALKERVNV